MSEYASHLPILRAVCGLLKPRSVLELGAGEFSTTFFLSQPIKLLVSVETDPVWRASVAKANPSARLALRNGYDELHPMNFDLLFIDDGRCQEEREASIRWALGRPRPPTIIHDAEVYATVISEFVSDFAIIPTQPATAVIWP